MSYERIYNKYQDNHNHVHGVEDAIHDTEMNSVENWRLKTLYVDTQYVYAAKTDEVLTSDQLFAQHNRQQTHPSCLPVILKDSSRPYTYYTLKSYGDAQDHNYYVNFDDHVNGSSAATPGHHYNNNCSSGSTGGNNANASKAETVFENEYGPKMSVDDSTCAKTYLCSLLGCFVCCLFQMKPV
jgi:hypothetical protein